MRHFIALWCTLMLLPGLLPAQRADIDGWSKIKWGMSVSEARTAFGDQTVDLTGLHTADDRFIVKNIKIGEISAEATVQTKTNSDLVSAVTIESGDINDRPYTRVSKFNTLKTLLIEKYGAPQNEDHKTVSGTKSSTVVWSFPSTSITLLWEESSAYSEGYQRAHPSAPTLPTIGYVTVTYRAVDKKALDAL